MCTVGIVLLTADLLLANRVTHCAFSCLLAIILTAAVAVVWCVMRAHGVCTKRCLCACIRELCVDEHITANPTSIALFS
jgi:hypothetical protein